MKVKLISITPNCEDIISYCARVSNPANQDSKETKLLNYCIKNQHWSIFEMGNMVLEIKTSRSIARQILRHRSFSFQEFSQRYAVSQEFELYDARSQDLKNRQNSIDDLSDDDTEWFIDAQQDVQSHCELFYKEALNRGIAKECARFLLPESSTSIMYMNGSIRSWMHYINLRCDNGTQLEHKEIANECKKIFCEQLPIIGQALGWSK